MGATSEFIDILNGDILSYVYNRGIRYVASSSGTCRIHHIASGHGDNVCWVVS